MTRCLWLARAAPYPMNDGASIASAKSIEGLADAGADIVCLGFSAPEGFIPAGAAARDARVEWRVVKGSPLPPPLALPSRYPLVAARHATAAYRRSLVEALAEPWDAIMLDHYAMGWALAPLQRARTAGGGRPVTAHLAHNFETEVTRAIQKDFRGDPVRKGLLYLNRLKTEALERRLAQGCDLVVALTAEDAASFRALSPKLETLVCPPGYDGPRAPPRSLAGTGRRICMIGSLRWLAKQMNLEAFLAVADPLFAAAGVELDIIGDAPEDYVARLAPRLKASRFLGFVDDLGEAVKAYRMGLVIEETGGGFKLKTLDYIFGRLPVAALEGSFRGIPAAVAETFVMGSTAEALAQAVVERIEDVGDLDRRQTRAFDAAGDAFNWRTNGTKLLEAFRRRAGASA
jgi:glycosyltransferase involved in cell wall biosynthesis